MGADPDPLGPSGMERVEDIGDEHALDEMSAAALTLVCGVMEVRLKDSC